MSDDRRPIDRYLDRVLRLLERSEEAYKAERKRRRAEERKKKQERQTGADSDEPPKH